MCGKFGIQDDAENQRFKPVTAEDSTLDVAVFGVPLAAFEGAS